MSAPEGRKITAAQKHALMTKLLATQAGRQKIAASMQEPLRKLRDYEAIGRKAFFIDELPDGALPIYDMDPDLPAYVVGEEGDSVQTIVKSKRLLVPLFELAAYPKIPFTQVKERRFDVVRRVKEKIRSEIFRKEDRQVFALMRAASAANTQNVTASVARGSFTMDNLADQFAKVERWGLRVDKIYMNANEFPVIRKAGRDYLDFETQRELLRTGYMGNLWGASVYQSPEVAVGEIFFVTEPEYFGVCPVRLDLTVLPADDPGARAFGWSAFENLGFAIHNTLGISCLLVTG